MPLFAESEEEIFSEVLLSVMKNTGITRTSPGSKTRSLIESLVKKIVEMQGVFDQNVGQSFLDGAEGQYLDYLGDMLGLGRIGEKPASVGKGDKVVRFYRDVALTEITIPAGTVVSTSEGKAGVSYRTITQEVMPASNATGREVYVSVISTSTGALQNVGKGTLTFHNLSSLPDLLVTNEADITTGQDVEADSNFRFRIANQVFSAEAANETSIRMAALAVPGVADIVMIPFFRGVGTFDMLIKATTPSVPESLLAAVREKLFTIIAQGVSFDVRKPRETGVSMSLNITLKETISSQDELELQTEIQKAIINYIDNLDIGEDLIINEIVQRVMELSGNIRNVGTAGKPIAELIVYKETNLQDNKLSETVFSGGASPIDYVAEIDEKLLIHSALTVPVLVTTTRNTHE
mgnify:CR=1 FL=1